MNMNMTQVLQITTLLTFLGTIIAFFIKTGEAKNGTQKDIVQLQNDVHELQNNHKEIEKEVNTIKETNSQAIARMETLLIEVKTKLEIIMQLSGFFHDENSKK